MANVAMHIGYFSSILGRSGGPAVVDKKVIERISQYDKKNRYTVYGTTSQSTQDLNLYPNNNIEIKTVKPSGKWLAIPFGLTWELMRRPVDLLHATIVAPPIVPCKFILTITCWSQYSQPEFYPPLVRMRLLYLLNKAIRKASAFFCYTDYLKQKMMERFHIDPQRIFIIRPAVGEEIQPIHDKSYLHDFLRKKDICWPYILFIGSITKRKNIDGLLNAYNILVNDHNIEQKLVLLGERLYYSSEVVKMIHALGLEDRVIFMERHPYDQLPFFYTGADVFVFPTYSEGFGLPPLEAMTCGTPVVASNVTSVPEVVGDAALMVDPHSPEDMAQAIYRFLTDEQLRDQYIEKGITRASEFTWERTAIQTVDAYEQIYQQFC